MCLRVTILGAQVYIHTVEVTGSNPVSPTNGKPLISGAFFVLGVGDIDIEDEDEPRAG